MKALRISTALFLLLLAVACLLLAYMQAGGTEGWGEFRAEELLQANALLPFSGAIALLMLAPLVWKKRRPLRS